MLYFMHETIWNPKTARKAPPTRHRAAAKRLHPVGRSEETWLFTELGVSVARNVPERRRESAKSKIGTWTSSQTEARPEKSFDANLAKRGTLDGIPHRPVDHEACCRGNRKAIWREISPQSPLAPSDRPGLELPEARKESPRTRRKSHTALETPQMAAYKKTQIGLVPIWYFLTKAAFFWFPISGAPGHRGDRLPACLWRVIGRRYRLFPPSAYLLKESAPPCISGSIPVKTSKHRKSNDFCTIFCVISKVLLFSCGIRVWFIGLAWLRSALGAIKESMHISFQVMRLNLTLLNSYGRNLKGLLLTPFPKIWLILKMSCVHLYTGFAIHNGSCGHVYGLRICHGGNVSIVYA